MMLTSSETSMEDALRSLQQQVSAPQNQNAALETQLRSQLNFAQGLQELLGANTTVLMHKHRREGCLSIRRACESH